METEIKQTDDNRQQPHKNIVWTTLMFEGVEVLTAIVDGVFYVKVHDVYKAIKVTDISRAMQLWFDGVLDLILPDGNGASFASIDVLPSLLGEVHDHKYSTQKKIEQFTQFIDQYKESDCPPENNTKTKDMERAFEQTDYGIKWNLFSFEGREVLTTRINGALYVKLHDIYTALEVMETDINQAMQWWFNGSTSLRISDDQSCRFVSLGAVAHVLGQLDQHKFCCDKEKIKRFSQFIEQYKYSDTSPENNTETENIETKNVETEETKTEKAETEKSSDDEISFLFDHLCWRSSFVIYDGTFYLSIAFVIEVLKDVSALFHDMGISCNNGFPKDDEIKPIINAVISHLNPVHYAEPTESLHLLDINAIMGQLFLRSTNRVTGKNEYVVPAYTLCQQVYKDLQRINYNIQSRIGLYHYVCGDEITKDKLNELFRWIFRTQPEIHNKSFHTFWCNINMLGGCYDGV
jgi:hypothetical protein